MTDSYPEPALLKGTNPEECELFVATVRRRAFAEGKQRDNEWIALFVSGYFIGDALYWYEGLEESVQNDWSRLRPALLARFGRTGPPSTAGWSIPTASSSTPTAAIPTPAAAPPTTGSHALVRKGRLKILHTDGSLRGYLAKTASDDGVHRAISTDPGSALYVSFTTPSMDGVFEIEIIDTFQLPAVKDILGAVWTNLTGDRWARGINHGASCCSFSTTTSKQSWAAERKVWKVSKDGELSVEYPKPNGGTERLLPSEQQSTQNVWWLKLSRTATDGWRSVRMVLEDAT